MYIQNQNDSKLIQKYEKAFETIKQEYAVLYKENQEMKKTIEQLKLNEKTVSENRKRSRLDYEDEYDANENVKYIVRKKKKTPKIIYEDEEEEKQLRKKKFKKKNKKGISKVIKM